jgi:hypothetical protein
VEAGFRRCQRQVSILANKPGHSELCFYYMVC